MRYLTPLLLIILICVMTYFLGGFLGILLKEDSCDGYKRVLNELQIEKEHLIREVKSRDEIITRMADTEYFNR